ncbi:uncharacterized protein [Nicotiana tomentosiformis]|uniref:uncharacterized protein n=1 Tax=Nicotiana tomentosiformis TaxID=4098 RepID=UPI00051AD1C8|nr:DTW domain-containing protein 2 [Nicotiana tomentosiformis]
MKLQFKNRVASLPGGNHFLTRKNPLPFRAHNLPQALEMVTESGHSKRPMCPSCSKPIRLCLCTRLKTPCLQNSVAVTILQHSLEKKHPLNSTRIASIEKYDANCSFQNQDLSKLFGSRAATDDIRKGFLVKKLQRKPLNGSSEYQESEEFEVAVPPGSVLLFPSENSIGMEEIDFEVKNLIVLDGTWAKAKRMYNENPWLKVLPHVKLDVEKLSLYSEVRHQPRAGYLSTIESIVYALKAVGEEDSEGLDHLLDVFESMVGDQRRCKDDRLKQRLSNCD